MIGLDDEKGSTAGISSTVSAEMIILGKAQKKSMTDMCK
jgi:hypothetical protein